MATISRINDSAPTQQIQTWATQNPTSFKVAKVASIILTSILGFIAAAKLNIVFAVLGTISFLTSLFLSKLNTLSASPAQPALKVEKSAVTSPSKYPLDSSQLVTLEQPAVTRADFLQNPQSTEPVVISKSAFVSQEMVAHLMRDKKDKALGVKYCEGDLITNMEGAMHTFVNPVVPILLKGDVHWFGGNTRCQGVRFAPNEARPVLLSALVNPDFELDNVVLPLVRLSDTRIEIGTGEDLRCPAPMTQKKAQNLHAIEAHDRALLKYMVHTLATERSRPALTEIAPQDIIEQSDVEPFLTRLVQKDLSAMGEIHTKYVRIGGNVISLDILCNLYRHQIRNEFKGLNHLAPNGFVYTINPPAIFAQFLGGAKVLNRMQALAFKILAKTEPQLFSSLDKIAFNQYADPAMIELLKDAFSSLSIEICSYSSLFGTTGQGLYEGPAGKALVLHNNSDGFGQNIETEGVSSLDGVMGNYSNAAALLKRNRPDLLDHIL